MHRVFPFIRRYALGCSFGGYVLFLTALYASGLYPRPGAHNLSRLIGMPVVTLEGDVINFPSIRWNQTRFLFEGKTVPDKAFSGRAVVTLNFTEADLAPGDRVRLRGWLTAPRDPTPKRSFDERSYWASFQTYAMCRVW